MTMISDAYNYIWNLVATNQFAQGGFLLAALGYIAMQLKSVPLMIWRYFKKTFSYQVTIGQDPNINLFRGFEKYLYENYPNKFRYVVGYVDYVDHHKSQDDTNRYKLAFMHDSDFFIIWYKHWPLYIWKEKSKMEHAMHTSDMYVHNYMIISLFNKRVVNQLLAELTVKLNAEYSNTTGIELIQEPTSDNKRIYIYKKFKNIYFKQKDELLSVLDNFKNRRDQLASTGIKNKLGIKLYGPPGSGKTTIATAIADYMKYNLQLINLASIGSDISFNKIINNVPSGTVILFEDIDDFHGKGETTRTKNVGKTNVSFSTLLQFLDGLTSPSDVIIIFTTNTPEDLDPALYRSGRINHKFEIGYPEKIDVINYLNDYYNTDINTDFKLKDKLTLADIEALCRDHNDYKKVIEKINASDTD